MQRLGIALAVACGLALATGCGQDEDDRYIDLPYLTATIFQPSCGETQCHSQYSQNGGIALDTPEHVRASVVHDKLVTFDFSSYDPRTPVASKLNIWLTQIEPGGKGTFRMPFDAPLPTKDHNLILAWIRDALSLPDACEGGKAGPSDTCGAGRAKGAQCDPGQFGGLACDLDKVTQCRDDWNFDNDGVVHTCDPGLGCVPVPRPVDDPDPQRKLEKQWCRSFCGDGKTTGTEDCDDQNTDPNDGCDLCAFGP